MIEDVINLYDIRIILRNQFYSRSVHSIGTLIKVFSLFDPHK